MCSKCNKEVAEGDYCIYCGNKLTGLKENIEITKEIKPIAANSGKRKLLFIGLGLILLLAVYSIFLLNSKSACNLCIGGPCKYTECNFALLGYQCSMTPLEGDQPQCSENEGPCIKNSCKRGECAKINLYGSQEECSGIVGDCIEKKCEGGTCNTMPIAQCIKKELTPEAEIACSSLWFESKACVVNKNNIRLTLINNGEKSIAKALVRIDADNEALSEPITLTGEGANLIESYGIAAKDMPLTGSYANRADEISAVLAMPVIQVGEQLFRCADKESSVLNIVSCS